MSKQENQDKEALLSALNAYGQNFLASFNLPQASTVPKRKRRKLDNVDSYKSSDESDEDEWEGFGGESESGASDQISEDEFSENEEDLMDSEGENNEETIEDDEFNSEINNKKQPEVVVFSGPSNPSGSSISKSQSKAFMSSKISRLREDVITSNPSKDLLSEDEYEEERNNAQNDALLHKLVHTKLLSGSLSQDLNMTPAQRRRALEGRVLELASTTKLGKGESSVREAERKKASKRVRMGLERKVDERREKALEEAKNLGNYHQSIKHVFKDESKSQNGANRKRERGLRLGVGKFSGGVLKLSKKDVEAVRENKRNSSQQGKGNKRKHR